MTRIPGTTPYAWPFDGRVDPARLALVVCGAAGEWAHRTPLDAVAEDHIATLRAVARRRGVFVALVDQATTGRGCDLPSDAAPALEPAGAERRVLAAGVDGFYGSSLDPLLVRAGCTHLLVAGRGFETTVHSTLRRANDRGYECLTVVDACVAIDPELRAAAVSTIEMSGGIFGAVGTTAAVAAALTPESQEDR